MASNRAQQEMPVCASKAEGKPLPLWSNLRPLLILVYLGVHPSSHALRFNLTPFPWDPASISMWSNLDHSPDG